MLVSSHVCIAPDSPFNSLAIACSVALGTHIGDREDGGASTLECGIWRLEIVLAFPAGTTFKTRKHATEYFEMHLLLATYLAQHIWTTVAATCAGCPSRAHATLASAVCCKFRDGLLVRTRLRPALRNETDIYVGRRGTRMHIGYTNRLRNMHVSPGKCCLFILRTST